MLSIEEGSTGAAIRAGLDLASHDVFVLFDGNTLVPHDYVARLEAEWLRSGADLIEWHGGLLLLTRQTLDRFGPPSDHALWTLEYFLRIRSLGGKIVVLDRPFLRLKPSPLGRNIQYGLDYAALSLRYGLAPFFAIGSKSGFLPDLFAALGAVLGYAKHGRLLQAIVQTPPAVRSFLSRRPGATRPQRDVRIRTRRLYIWRLARSKLRQEFHSRIANRVASVYRSGWILDLGCGPGYLESQIAFRLPTAPVIGVDIDDFMLAYCRSRESIEAVQATAAVLPFRDGSISLVVSSASLKDWSQRGLGMSEISRVLSSAGTGLVYEFITAGPGNAPQGFASRFGLVSDLLRRLARFATPFTLEDAVQVSRENRGEATISVSELSDLGIVEISLSKGPVPTQVRPDTETVS